ncbi:hypothetical protein PACTADRAFT_74442 [Pachysolen tannophilus NRRL Y-2460]|uniref:Nucleoporin NUP188 n=1 Tax=Pachysolen tannophilus NRRL Y-2460 TaxID=669874 RepID=A0A1E4TYS9_PACTA|nr:hypothetical protein PACTADRAFT_74442 [Pachysolen tannophilus NRRL Y-2460]
MGESSESSVNLGYDDDGKELSPLEPEASWTIDHAILLLQETSNPTMLSAVGKFLVMNKPILNQSLPFKLSKEFKDEEIMNLKELSLRGIKYSNVTEQNKKDAIKIARLFKLDPFETLRIVLQTSQKIPGKIIVEEATVKLSAKKEKSLLPIDKSTSYEDERIQLLSEKILRERRLVLQLMSLLIQNQHNNLFPQTVRSIGYEITTNPSLMGNSIESYEILVDFIMEQSYLTNASKQLNDLNIKEHYLLLIDSAKLLINLILNKTLEKKLALKWFQIMAKINFMSTMSKKIPQDTLIIIEALATIITVLVLDLDNEKTDLEDDVSFINDPNIFNEINTILSKAPTNPIVLYAWSIILYRKSLTIEEFPSSAAVKNFVSHSKNYLSNLKLIFNTFLTRANELDVCNSLIKCYNILKFDQLYTLILGSYVLSMLPYVVLTPKIATLIETIISGAPKHIIERFFKDKDTKSLILVLKSKIPLSFLSYIPFCNINGYFAFKDLSSLKSYMVSFNEEQLINKYVFDESNPEFITLTENIDVLPPYESSGELSLLLKPGTRGKFISISSEKEQFVSFIYEYNGLSLIGRILQNICKNFDVENEEKTSLAVYILNLLSNIFAVCSKSDQEEALRVTSAFVDGNDIIKVVCDIYSRALIERHIKILVAGNKLFNSLTRNFSEKVWTSLKTSVLLENKSRGEYYAIILGSVEMVHGNYDFTISLLELIDNLINSCFSITEKYIMTERQEILKKFTIFLIQIFEGFISWRYNHKYQKMQIGTLVSDLFSNILVSFYGMGKPEAKSEQRVKTTKVLEGSASKIIDAFLISNSNDVRSNKPIISMIESLSVALSTFATSDYTSMWYKNWIKSSFNLSTLLISARSMLGLKPSTFERSIFSKSSTLISVYAQFVQLRINIINLLTSLVSAKWPNEPPSLLAHLGDYYSNVLLRSLATDLNNTFDDYEIKIRIYDFFSAVMEGNQEGLSIMFITGRDIRESILHESPVTDGKALSILNILKKNVSSIYKFPDYVSIHLVVAISLAFNSWTTAKEGGNDKEFINELIKRIQRRPQFKTLKPYTSEDYVNISYEYKLISKIAEILALYLFVSKDEECSKNIENLLTDEKFMKSIESIFKITGYKPSLHSDLRNAFKRKWPEFKLAGFIRSPLVKTKTYGVDSIYDLAIMDKVFKDESDWEGYKEDIFSSSINLKYVESQIAAAKSLGALLTSYCNKVKTPLNPIYLKLVSKLLELNNEESITAPVFKDIYRERIELSFFIIYTVLKNNGEINDDPTAYEIIENCSNTLVSNDLDLITGLSDVNIFYYRPLLRTLLTALKMAKNDEHLLEEHSETFVSLFNLVISKSSRFLFSSIQNEALSSNQKEFADSKIINQRLEDVFLILSILKVMTRLKFSKAVHLKFASSLVENGSIKTIFNLYSCSHIIKINNEPVFAELTLSFIYELVSIRPIAERLISNGLFSILVESPISIIIQKGGIRPSASLTYHRIWNNGLLSILLTLLSTFGERVLPEIVMFLIYFSNQLTTSINAWFQDSIIISSAVIQETNQFVLLYKVLQALNVENYLASSNTNTGAVGASEIQFIPGLDTKEQRQELVNVFNYLLSHPKFLSMRVSPITPEEEISYERDNKKFIENIVSDIRELRDSLIY